VNLAGQNSETALQSLGHAEGLPDKTVQFKKHRTRAVGLKVRLPAFYSAGENPGSHELLKFPLDSAGTQAGGADDLPLIESLVGVSE